MGKFSNVGVSGNEEQALQEQAFLANKGRLGGARYTENTPYIRGNKQEMAAAAAQAGPSVPVTQGAVGPGYVDNQVPILGEASANTQGVLNATDPNLLNLSPDVVKAMEDVGLISPQGGVTYDPAVENRGQIAAFTNQSPQQLVESGMMPAGVDGGLQQKNADGRYTPLPKQEAINQIGWLQSNATGLNKTLLNASIEADGTPSRLGRIIANEMGQAATVRPEVSMNFLLGYYRAMEEASYADYSQEEKQEHSDYASNPDNIQAPYARAGAHPDLWETRQGKPPMTPQRDVLEQKVGQAIEEVSGIKFSSRENRDIMGQAVLRGMQQLGPEASLFNEEITYSGPAGQAFPIKGIAIETIIKNNRLGLTKGIRDLLQPNHRNNVRVTPLTKQRDPNAPLTGKQSGTSPIRTNADNIIEEMPMMLDQHFLNIFRGTWGDTNWVEFWEGRDATIKEDHVNILFQQDAYIQKNSPDGQTYYADRVQRDSGRKGSKNLLMEDIKVVRHASIAKDYVTKINLKKGKGKYHQDELELISALMANLGSDDYVMSKALSNFEYEYGDPASEGRQVAALLNELAKTGVVPTGLTPARLKPYMHESGDSLQALRAIDGYMRAKEKGTNLFETKFIGEVDASQSGQLIQAMMIGNIDAFLRGGGRSPLFHARMEKDLKLELPKLYTTTVANARASFMSIIQEDTGLGEFAQLLFGQDSGSLEGSLFAKDFAKTGIQGASYGQGKAGSIKAIRAKMIEWVEAGSNEEIQTRVDAVNKFLGGPHIEIMLNNSSRNNTIVLHDAALAHMDKLAGIFTQGMYDADTRILEYSKKMRKMFKSYVKISAFANENGLDFGTPEMVYMEGKDHKKPYGAQMEGMRTDMLDKHIPSEYLSIPFLGADEVGNLTSDWDQGDIYYQKGYPEHDLAKEVEGVDFESDVTSAGITRFPVISLHGLDDLAISIAINEMSRKYPDDFKYFMSVWDAGRIPPLLRNKFAEEYNKALAHVVKNNRFFENLSVSFNDFINSIPADKIAKINSNTKAGDAFKQVRKDAQSLVTMARAFRKPKLAGPGEGARGTVLLDQMVDEFGFTNMDTGMMEGTPKPRKAPSKKAQVLNSNDLQTLMDLGI